MSRENLEKKNKKELVGIATDLKITGRWDMTKPQLIEAILGAKSVETNDDNKLKSANDECKVDNCEVKNVEVESKIEKESAGIDVSQKLAYVENVEVGTIVAFKLSNGRVKSAKVVRKSSKNRKLKLETDYGAEYIVSYDDIIWVRTGKRWPKGVYNLLKGIGVESNVKEVNCRN